MRKHSSSILARVTLGLFVFLPLALTPNLTLDAVNLGKFFLFTLAGSLAAIQFLGIRIQKSLRVDLLVLWLFLVIGVSLPLFLSDAPFQQQLFGVWGRNIGVLTYFACLMAMTFGAVYATKLREEFLGKCFLICASISLFYGLMQSRGYDFVSWSSPAVFGTLGNINFYSAHIAIIFSILLPLLLNSQTKSIHKVVLSAPLFICIFLLLKARSAQGFLVVICVTFLALHIVLIRRNVRMKMVAPLSFATSIVLSALSFAGIGPLAPLANSELLSFRIRIYFWEAALRMFADRPLFGVGLDSFEDWYRITRSTDAYRGGDLNEATDSAHNLLLDYAAVGGVALLLFGCCVIFLVIRSSLAIIARFISHKDSHLLVPLSLVFGSVAFLIQSMVSPQQMGLLSWGFLMFGLLLGYSKNLDLTQIHMAERSTKHSKAGNIDFESRWPTSFKLVASSFLLLFSLLPFSLLVKERIILSTQREQNVELFISAIQAFPTNAVYLRNGIAIIERAGYHGRAVKIGLESVKQFPRNYLLLETVANLRSLDSTAKARIQSQMDVLNPRR